MPDKNTFFILGHARTGTTSMARTLQLASNAKVYIEQPPKICYESRDVYKGLLDKSCIYDLKKKHIADVHKQGLIYGDKNQNYLVFLKTLSTCWNAKFIFMVRDPRDVIRSSMSWSLSRNIKGGLYELKEDGHDFNNTKKDDWWDYSRLRPNPEHPIYPDWKATSLFEKICWAWAEYYTILMNCLKNISSQDYLIIDINALDINLSLYIYNFLGLTINNKEELKRILQRKTNSIVEKTGENHKFPHWKDWDKTEKKICSEYCSSIYNELLSLSMKIY